MATHVDAAADAATQLAAVVDAIERGELSAGPESVAFLRGAVAALLLIDSQTDDA